MSAKSVILFGASGTIGSATARALVTAGHNVTCVQRSPGVVRGARVAQFDTLNGDAIRELFFERRYHAVISCLASRSGVPEDAWKVDYETNALIFEMARKHGVDQGILLSAICVQKPKLAFQHAKLAAESELQGSGMTWTIIRPTAFFKSLSGQVERVRRGKPFLLFGDGELTRCKPISDDDLARYIVSALDHESMHNRILPIGGPGPAISPMEQGEKLFELLGEAPCYRRMPVGMMDAIIGALSLAGRVSKRAAAKAEYARIGRYYATESMLVWDAQAGRYDEAATPEFGEETLWDHYAKLTGKTAK